MAAGAAMAAGATADGRGRGAGAAIAAGAGAGVATAPEGRGRSDAEATEGPGVGSEVDDPAKRIRSAATPVVGAAATVGTEGAAHRRTRPRSRRCDGCRRCR
jgi:hypothetical protein